MIVAIVAILLVTAICFSLVRIALAAGQQAQRQGWRLQSVWLAESALAQAVSRLRSDADFTGDTWTLDEIGGTHTSGRVEVTLTPDDDNPRMRTVTATADVPDHPTDRVRITRTLTLILPETTPAATDGP